MMSIPVRMTHSMMRDIKHAGRYGAASLLVACLLYAVGAGQEPKAEAPRRDIGNSERLAILLKHVGERVERYQSVLLSISFTETLREERLKRDLTTADGKAKEYVFANIVLRQSIEGDEEDSYAKTIRRLRSVNGQTVKQDEPYFEKRTCVPGPADSYADPLTFLLPQAQPRYEFSDEGTETRAGRRVHLVGVVPRGQAGPKVEHKGDCFWAVVPFRGRIWIDAESGDVLQLEWRLVERFAYESPRVMHIGSLRFGPKRKLSYERFEIVTHFSRVEFKDPAQTLLLPVSSTSLRVIEGAGRPRVRVTQTFTDYRRFVSDVKVIEETEP